jgi:hypothetical protein
MYSDADLDQAARRVIKSLSPEQAKRLGDIEKTRKELKREDGFIGHTSVNTFCQYSEKEVQ